jgi:hypothetical protein
MKPQEVTDALKLSQLKDKIWYVVPSCATTGEGLLEGLVSYATSFPQPSCAANANQGMALKQRQVTTRTSEEIKAMKFSGVRLVSQEARMIDIYLD